MTMKVRATQTPALYAHILLSRRGAAFGRLSGCAARLPILPAPWISLFEQAFDGGGVAPDADEDVFAAVVGVLGG